MDAFRRWVENRLGGYRHHVNAVDLALPLELVSPRRVAVVGAGLAGLVAATTLARRGFSVVLYEQKPYLGGKIGAWPVAEVPFKLGRTPAHSGGLIDRGAPCYGEDNAYVLGELLGHSQAEIRELESEGVI